MSRRPAPSLIFRRLRPVLFCGALALAFGPAAARAAVQVGDAFPSLATVRVAHDATLPALKGQVVLVDFWASWCAPCKASFPAYAKLYTDYRARALVVVAISVDEKVPAYAAFVKQLAPPFPVALDWDQTLVREVQVPTMPTSYLLDRSGRVRFIHPGFHGASTEADLRKEIELLLAEPAK